MTLKRTTGATVMTIIDNYIDVLLPSGDRVKRPPLAKGNRRMPPLLAFPGAFVLNASHTEIHL